jgi:arginyl-tRNA synthetase
VLETHSPEHAFRAALERAVVRALGITPQRVPLTYPPNASLGDLASPICFELAREARKPPRVLAEAVVEAFEPGGGIARVEIAGAGYINAFLERNAFLRDWLTPKPVAAPSAEGPKRIVEHTNINPNKAAHIGHLRNAVLGDTLVRCLRHLGRRVEVQNYIDDTGVQVADLVVGFRTLRQEGLEEVRVRYDADELAARDERFDYVAWDLYAEVTRYYEQDPERRAQRAETLHAMEQGDNPVAELAAWVSHRIVQHHLKTMERIGVRYDLLPKESDILALRFWDDAFRLLKQRHAIHQTHEGKNAGCWVMDLPGAEKGAGEDQKVIVRSDGTVTYVGKDIAYQMWKFGLLGRDFEYRPFDWSPAAEAYALWATTAEPGATNPPSFGGGHTVYNVIDTRQAYLQRVVAQGLRSLGFEEEARRSIHFSYDMVALTPASVEALFPDHPLSDADRAKPYLEMSGRRGLGVRADDLVDALFARAGDEVRRRHPDLPEAEILDTARRIAVGALRYYMLRFSRNRVVAFDLDDALAFEGETGPYLQYSIVRARNILRKVAERFGPREVDPEALAGTANLDSLDDDAVAEHWTLALLLSRVRPVVRQAVESLELATVAKHAYVLAQTFNSFYHRYPVAQESDVVVRRTRIALVEIYQAGMTRLLDLMGIEMPQRM